MPQSILEQAMQSQDQAYQQQQLQQAPEIAPIDVDRSARIFYVQAKTKLPSDVIDADLDNLYEQVKRNEFDYKNYTAKENGSPIFNEWAASDPYHAAVVERDRRNMTLIERQFDAMGRGWDRGDAMFELSRISNRRRAGDEREGDDEVLADLREIVEADDFGLTGWASVLVETGAQANIQLEILEESAGLALAGAAEGALAGWAVGAWSGPGSGITALGGAATGLGVGWRVGAFESGRKLEQGLAYDEYVQLGASPEEAKRVSGYVGVANGALELIGINAMVKFMPGAKRLQGKMGKYMIERMFSKPTVAGAHRLLVARYGEVMATEIFTEILQESITMGGSEYLKRQMREAGDVRPELAPMGYEEWVDAVSEIAVKTVKGTLLLGGIGPGASYIGDIRRARNAKATGAYLKSVGEAASDNEMRKDPRLAPKFKEYLQAQAKKGPVDEVRFDMDAWIDYWEAQGQDVEQVSKALGINLEEVWAQGGDVVIDLETFGEKLAHTDHFNRELWKDAKLRTDDMSYREATDFLANPEEHVNRLKEDLKDTFGVEVSDDFDRIVKDVTGMLVQAKYDEKAAEQQARLMAAVFTTQALRNPNANLTPWDLYQERLSGIRLDVRDTAARPGAVDLTVDPLLDRIRSGDIPGQRQIFGDSLIDFVVKQGGLVDDGGELSARDYRKLRRGLIKETGDTLDGMAELAHEQGYIAARDPNLLLEMMDRELQMDEPVFAARRADQELQTLAEDLNELANYLESEGLDVEKMTNQEIREALNRRQTFEQTDKTTLEELGELIMATIGNPKTAEAYAEDLIKIEGMIPRVAEDQDFGDLEFTDRVRISGREGTRKRKAQKVFDTEVKKRNALKTLMDCMSVKR
jgi:hypothetical protein